ncbi:MAG: hypothetical protein WCP39_07400 [Chlamydiota bacterium]
MTVISPALIHDYLESKTALKQIDEYKVNKELKKDLKKTFKQFIRVSIFSQDSILAQATEVFGANSRVVKKMREWIHLTEGAFSQNPLVPNFSPQLVAVGVAYNNSYLPLSQTGLYLNYQAKKQALKQIAMNLLGAHSPQELSQDPSIQKKLENWQKKLH